MAWNNTELVILRLTSPLPGGGEPSGGRFHLHATAMGA